MNALDVFLGVSLAFAFRGFVGWAFASYQWRARKDWHAYGYGPSLRKGVLAGWGNFRRSFRYRQAFHREAF